MYIPRSFVTNDPEKLHALIRDFNFAILITHTDRAYITHLPFLLDTTKGEHGTLIAHMARANPHWKALGPETESIVLFQGPHCYVSPSWYENQETVPTWNYAAAHVYGNATAVEDAGRLREFTERLIDYHEAPLGRPWDVSKSAPVMDGLLNGIVGVEMEISRIEGKFKFNQNHSTADQRGVIAALEESEGCMESDVARIMRENLGNPRR